MVRLLILTKKPRRIESLRGEKMSHSSSDEDTMHNVKTEYPSSGCGGVSIILAVPEPPILVIFRAVSVSNRTVYIEIQRRIFMISHMFPVIHSSCRSFISDPKPPFLFSVGKRVRKRRA